jgi:DNA-directed RNA polymerase specialized sigma24 family protein
MTFICHAADYDHRDGRRTNIGNSFVLSPKRRNRRTRRWPSAFAGVRPRLFGIAYRMLGSAADAEDVVQGVWLRWQSTNRNVVENPAAFLATTTTRICINLVQSAHTRRETYVGTWLPEPVDTSADPTIGAERAGRH